MAALNSSYVNIYLTVERGSISEARLRMVIEKYNKSEEQRNKLAEVAKAAREENAKVEAEKAELLKQLQAQKVDL